MERYVVSVWIRWKEVAFVMRNKWQEGTSHGKTRSRAFWAEEMLPSVKLSTGKHNRWFFLTSEPSNPLSLKCTPQALVSELPLNHLSLPRMINTEFWINGTKFRNVPALPGLLSSLAITVLQTRHGQLVLFHFYAVTTYIGPSDKWLHTNVDVW